MGGRDSREEGVVLWVKVIKLLLHMLFNRLRYFKKGQAQNCQSCRNKWGGGQEGNLIFFFFLQ